MSRDRPALEAIEITEEMIEAGALELSRFNSDFAPLEEGVERIVRAALDARSGEAER